MIPAAIPPVDIGEATAKVFDEAILWQGITIHWVDCEDLIKMVILVNYSFNKFCENFNINLVSFLSYAYAKRKNI